MDVSQGEWAGIQADNALLYYARNREAQCGSDTIRRYVRTCTEAFHAHRRAAARLLERSRRARRTGRNPVRPEPARQVSHAADAAGLLHLQGQGRHDYLHRQSRQLAKPRSLLLSEVREPLAQNQAIGAEHRGHGVHRR